MPTDKAAITIREIPRKLRQDFRVRCLHLGQSMTRRIVYLIEQDLRQPTSKPDYEELIG